MPKIIKMESAPKRVLRFKEDKKTKCLFDYSDRTCEYGTRLSDKKIKCMFPQCFYTLKA